MTACPVACCRKVMRGALVREAAAKSLALELENQGTDEKYPTNGSHFIVGTQVLMGYVLFTGFSMTCPSRQLPEDIA